MPTYILGVSGGFRANPHDTAAVLLRDGQVVQMIEEERLRRIKHARGVMPRYAIGRLLQDNGLRIDDIDVLAFYSSPPSIAPRIRRFMEFHFGGCPEIRLFDHHLCHAASAYLISGMDEAAIITADLSGDGCSGMLAHGVGGEIRELRRFPKPNSLGIYYSVITQLAGFQRDADEYKVMGLAPFGEPTIDLSWLLTVGDGSYNLDARYLNVGGDGQENPAKEEPMFSEEVLQHLRPPRPRDEPVGQYHRDLAASAQQLLEEALLSLTRWTVEESGSRNLCLAGGTMLNCSATGVIGRTGLVDQIYTPPSASDAGTALGAALLAAQEMGLPLPAPVQHAGWGTEYDEDAVERALQLAQLRYQRLDDPADTAAALIANGNVIGWFQGPMEFGPRALGFRSILGDPRSAAMRDLINAKIKFREEFRPFAPSVLEERAEEWFEDAAASPFMTRAFVANTMARERIPAVVHVNGTSRVQTVAADYPGRYRAVIEAFESRTGVPVVLNTSFNRQGEPIVEAPLDAVSTFFGSGLDALVIDRFLVTKR